MRVAALLAASALPVPETRALLAHVLAVPREQLIAHPEWPVEESTERNFRELVARRNAGEPLAYLLGAREFYGREFRVTPQVLVPRPETEALVEAALGCIAGMLSPRVLELGTGSGCIAITLALEHGGAVLTATDLSPAALDVARANAGTLGASVHWIQSDWMSDLVPSSPFDLIVSNPPYVAAGDPHLRDLRHEPQIALTGGADGLACLRAICARASVHLTEGGWIALEHGYDQAAAVRNLLAEAGLGEVHSRRDLAGLERISLARR